MVGILLLVAPAVLMFALLWCDAYLGEELLERARSRRARPPSAPAAAPRRIRWRADAALGHSRAPRSAQPLLPRPPPAF